MTGTVVSVDQQARTLTVKREVKGKTQEETFGAEKGALSELAQLKAGDHVRIAYVKRDGQLIAESVTPSAQAEKK